MFQDNDGGLSGYQPDAIEAQAMLIPLIYERDITDQDINIIDSLTLQDPDLFYPSDPLVQVEII